MADPDDEMMEATYRALCEHGYVDLTMQRIADKSSKSKAALHYHYDTKEDLLLTFLEHVIEWFKADLATDSVDPEERIRSIVKTIFDRAEEDRGEYVTALLEIKAQAPYNEDYRDRIHKLDEWLRRTVADAVRDGVEQGVFAEVNPDEVARFVATAMNAAHTREVALGEDPNKTRVLVGRYLESELGISFEEEVSS